MISASVSFALAIMECNNPETLYVARRKSPLLIGVNENEKIIASDFSAIADYTNQVYLLESDEIAELTNEKMNIYDNKLNLLEKEEKYYHDLKNHLQVLESLYKRGNIEKCRLFCFSWNPCGISFYLYN